MTKQRIILILLLGAAILLAGCAAPSAVTPAPTQDLAPLRTEVAATVLAQVPQICALTPTATALIPPTNTPPPTLAQTATSAVTATLAVTLPAAGTPAATLEGGVTATPSGTDLAKWISQTVSDGAQFQPNQEFIMTWRIQNVGTTTWTAGYRLRFFSGDAFGAPNEIALDRAVAPNDTVEITVGMKAPARPGTYRSDWVLSNESLRNFKEPVYLSIVVPGPTATPTRTAVPVATKTALPTPTSKP